MSELWTNLSYRHLQEPDCSDKRGSTATPSWSTNNLKQVCLLHMLINVHRND